MRKTFDNWAATNRCDVGSDLTWLTRSSLVTQRLHWLFCDCCSLKRLISLQPVYKTLGCMLWYFLGLSSTIIRILKKIFESILVSNKTNIWKNLCWSEVCFVTTVRVKFGRWQTGRWGWNRPTWWYRKNRIHYRWGRQWRQRQVKESPLCLRQLETIDSLKSQKVPTVKH